LKILKKLLAGGMFIVIFLVGYTLINYPHLFKLKKLFVDNPQTYFFDEKYSTSSEFEHMKTTNLVSYSDNVKLMENNSTKKCPFFYTPDEEDNRGVILADNHILFENNEELHQKLRQYVIDFVPDSSTMLNRLNSKLSKIDLDEMDQNNFEQLAYYALFGTELNHSESEMIIEYRILSRKVAMLPSFIRNILLRRTLKQIDEIKLYFENKFLNEGHIYPQLVFDVFWFNQAPLFGYYQNIQQRLESDSKLLREVKDNKKTENLVEEIFRLYPAVRVIPYEVDGEYFSANISLANIDSTVFPNPLTINLNRDHYDHLTFASPSKRGCVGKSFSKNFLSTLINKRIDQS